MRQGPLAGRYPAAAAMVMFALIPYLALSAAIGPVTPLIGRDLHISPQAMSVGSGMANAAYAAGTVMAVYFAQLLRQRRIMLLYVSLLVIGSILAAAAQNPAMFFAGHVLQGLCTSLLLIAAVPPLALGFGVEKFRSTAVIMSMCIFGAVTLGPAIGGLQAQADAWRPLFWVIAGISAAALVLALLTFEDTPPADVTAPRNPLPIGLAAAGSVAAFFGASQLLTHKFLEFRTAGMLALGLGLIVVLIVSQYRAKRPLLTIRTMLSSTIPVAGIVLALCAAAASVSATALTASLLAERYSPLHVGLLYLPELAGATLTAVLLGVVIDKRALQYLPVVGMVFLAAGIAVFRIQLPPTQALTLIGSGLTGIGLGASVAPALFTAGFSLPAATLQRVFAIVELLRAVAAFMIAPVFAHLAVTVGGDVKTGHEHRALDRPRTRDRRCRRAGPDLPTRRSTPGDAAARAVHGRRGPGVVLAPAPGRGPQTRDTPARRRRPGPVMTPAGGSGPVVFAYDGSELAKHAIGEAGRLLEAGGEALVVTVWQPFDVGFLPPAGLQLDAAQIADVRTAAAQTAADGAALAQAAGFHAHSAEIERSPTWKGIAELADAHDARLIVLGSHGRSGLAGALVGSVAGTVAAHSRRSVLIVHRGS